jgi:aromatic-L-amino-acid/L-tryptophan decarboxylase
MNTEPIDLAHWSHQAVAWGSQYRDTVAARCVRPKITPGDIAAKIAASPPEACEDMGDIFKDFEEIIVPGMTHWQHPRFFAYFPSNAPAPAVVADQLATFLAPQCMLWQTSPAATELEMVMVDWMRQAFGLPDIFKGTLQDGASSGTLAAILTMRERALALHCGANGNAQGLFNQPRLRVYCSREAHSSVQRAMWFSGIGEDNLVPLPITGALRGADPEALERLIEADKAAGFLPAGIVINIGATGCGATDPAAAMVAIAKKHNLYTHVDAAWAGSAMLCPELRTLWAGVEGADSIVISGHKWLGVHPSCALHFVANPHLLHKALAARPSYLHTAAHAHVLNFSEWGIQLGRPFRALKLWFLLRAYGLEAIRNIIRSHVAWAKALVQELAALPHIEIVTQPILALFTFRLVLPDATEAALTALNTRFIEALNDDGHMYITPTDIDGKRVVRLQIGNYNTAQEDVTSAAHTIARIAAQIMAQELL